MATTACRRSCGLCRSLYRLQWEWWARCGSNKYRQVAITTGISGYMLNICTTQGMTCSCGPWYMVEPLARVGYASIIKYVSYRVHSCHRLKSEPTKHVTKGQIEMYQVQFDTVSFNTPEHWAQESNSFGQGKQLLRYYAVNMKDHELNEWLKVTPNAVAAIKSSQLKCWSCQRR